MCENCNENGKYPLVDARGIFCTYVCHECEAEARKTYRPEIFMDCNYPCNEQIEEE